MTKKRNLLLMLRTYNMNETINSSEAYLFLQNTYLKSQCCFPTTKKAHTIILCKAGTLKNCTLCIQ